MAIAKKAAAKKAPAAKKKPAAKPRAKKQRASLADRIVQLEKDAEKQLKQLAAALGSAQRNRQVREEVAQGAQEVACQAPDVRAEEGTGQACCAEKEGNCEEERCQEGRPGCRGSQGSNSVGRGDVQGPRARPGASTTKADQRRFAER